MKYMLLALLAFCLLPALKADPANEPSRKRLHCQIFNGSREETNKAIEAWQKKNENKVRVFGTMMDPDGKKVELFYYYLGAEPEPAPRQAPAIDPRLNSVTA